MSTFRFFVMEHFVFFSPLKKTSFGFVFVCNTKKNVFKNFDIELVTIYGGLIRY